MHPIIKAWLEYKKLADWELSYSRDRHMYANWIYACRRAHDWYWELVNE